MCRSPPGLCETPAPVRVASTPVETGSGPTASSYGSPHQTGFLDVTRDSTIKVDTLYGENYVIQYNSPMKESIYNLKWLLKMSFVAYSLVQFQLSGVSTKSYIACFNEIHN